MNYAKEEAERIGMEKGLEKGIEKGKLQEKVEIARNLLDVLDDETIALKTTLSIDMVRSLRQV